jgi:membrane associated rhomboid family serine protease
MKKNIPVISIILVSILFITNILTLYFPFVGDAVLLYPSRIAEPLNWYRFLTYPLYVSGLLAWIINSIIIVATGFVIESRLNKKEIYGLIVLSTIAGGLGFALMNLNDVNNVSLAAPVMISWGYWSATVVIGLKFWKELKISEKVITVLCFISVFSIWDIYIALTLGKVLVVLTITTLVLFKYKKRLVTI